MNESSSHHRHKSRKVVYDLYCLSNKTSQGTFHIGLSVSRRRLFLNPQLHSVFRPSALLKQKYWVTRLPDKLHQNPPVRQRKQFHSREKTPLSNYTPLDTLHDSRNKAEKGDFAWHSRHQVEETGWPQHKDHFFSNMFHIILEDLLPIHTSHSGKFWSKISPG